LNRLIRNPELRKLVDYSKYFLEPEPGLIEVEVAIENKKKQ
jgi:hypothetical protein